ncbi:hypothetical protein [Bradyrhizobium genosp. SA-3]|uniref:hypothetical protein n=1 Tax=Bradyrhizobium genosp. SA-3 TaxID=508868 RepID=UPI00102995D6|nr:hypothetical protein [Bradyrhizobium genosp. SA-3]
MLGYHLLFHLLKPFLWYYFNHNHAFEYMQFYPSEESVTNSIFISIAGLLSSYSAYVLLFRYDNDTVRAKLAAAISSARISVTTRAAILVVMALSFGAFVQRLRGYLGEDVGVRLVQDARTGVQVFSEGSGWWFELSSAYVFCGIYLWMTSRFSRPWAVAMSTLGFLWLTVGRSRFVFVYWAITVLILVLIRSKLNARKLLVFAPLAAILITSFVLLGQNRAAIREMVLGGDSKPQVSDTWNRASPLDTLDMSTFEVQTALIDAVPRLTDSFSYFTQHLRILTEPIPRALWSDKPLGNPIEFFDINRFVNLTSLSTGWYGEGWLSYGILGVLTTCVIYVALSSFALRILLMNGGPNAAFVYIVLIPLHLQWMRDGVLISILKFTLFLTLPAIIAAVVAKSTRTDRNFSAKRQQFPTSRSQI